MTEFAAICALAAIAFVVWIGLGFWREVRLAEAEAALQREMLQKGMSLEEIDRALQLRSQLKKSAASSDEAAFRNLAESLTHVLVLPPQIEEIMTQMRGADPETREAVAQAALGIVDKGDADCLDTETQKQLVLAALRGILGKPEAPAEPNAPAADDI